MTTTSLNERIARSASICRTESVSGWVGRRHPAGIGVGAPGMIATTSGPGRPGTRAGVVRMPVRGRRTDRLRASAFTLQRMRPAVQRRPATPQAPPVWMDGQWTATYGAVDTSSNDRSNIYIGPRKKMSSHFFLFKTDPTSSGGSGHAGLFLDFFS
jgi:hypothetical protein